MQKHRAPTFGAPLASPNPPAPPPASAGLVAIHAGRLVDVDKGEMVRDRWIVIEGERIRAVLPAGAALPAGARRLDLSAYTAR